MKKTILLTLSGVLLGGLLLSVSTGMIQAASKNEQPCPPNPGYQNCIKVNYPVGGESIDKTKPLTINWQFQGIDLTQPVNNTKTAYIFLERIMSNGSVQTYSITKSAQIPKDYTIPVNEPHYAQTTINIPQTLPDGNYKVKVLIKEIHNSLPNLVWGRSGVVTLKTGAPNPTPAPSPKCSDGIDNDSDGKVDYPADPGCTSGTDNDETDPVIPPTPVKKCSDGIDNDSDGKTDYPSDPGCTSATDNDETDPVVPPTPTPSPGSKVLVDTISDGLFNAIFIQHDCSLVRLNDALTRQPDGSVSHYGERRFMVQMRMFECAPQAMKAVRATLSGAPAGSTKSTATYYFNDAVDRLKVGAIRYSNGIVRTLFHDVPSAKPLFAQFSDAAYPWIYPNNSMKRLNWTIDALESPMVPDIATLKEAFLTSPIKKRQSAGNNVDRATALQYGQSFAAKPLDPLADKTKIDIINSLEQIHRDGVKAMWCVKTTGKPCPGSKTPQQFAADYDVARATARSLGLPITGPSVRGFDSGMSTNQLCKLNQRDVIIHDIWTKAIRDEINTPAGEAKGWLALLAHSFIHADRYLGVNDKEQSLLTALNTSVIKPDMIDPNEEPMVSSEQMDVKHLRNLLQMNVPGSPDGVTCELQPENLPQPAAGVLAYK